MDQASLEVKSKTRVLHLDVAEAKRFLDVLDPDGQFVFQTFDDDKSRKDPQLTKWKTGRLDDCATPLKHLNQWGAGIFHTVNSVRPGERRLAENVDRVRAVFVDLDGAPIDPVWTWTHPPHIVVESSPGKFHAYWLVDNSVRLEDFKPFQRKLATVFNSDPAVSNLNCVLRTPGSWHQKVDKEGRRSKPFMTRIVHIAADRTPYTREQLESALAGVKEKRPANGKEGQSAPRVRRPRSELTALEWLNQSALDRIKDWAPRAFPGGEMHGTGAYRVSPDATCRGCEEDLSISPDGIRDFGQERVVDDAAVGYTPVSLLQAFFDCVNSDGELEPAEAYDPDNPYKPKGTLSHEDARNWLATALCLDWDALCQEDVERAFASPPFDVGELQRLSSADDIRSRIDDFAMLRAGRPDAYEEVAGWHCNTLGTIDRAELDRLTDRDASVTGAPVSAPPALPPKRPKILSLDDVAAFPEPNDFVEELLCSNQSIVVYGDANVGKSFVIQDLALHIACGLRWHGRQTDRSGVLYVALEGSGGTKRRIDAWLKHFGEEKRASAAFALSFDALNLREPRDVKVLIEASRGLPIKFGVPLRLIVIDTLSRALAGGNENAPDDMGALVRGVDQLRNETGASVLLIHHSGKDDARGARGHSLLRAAIDTEMKIERCEGQEEGVIQVTVTKQRDFERGGGFTFRLRPVELGTNRRGKSIASCVVEAATVATPALKDNEKAALDLLENMLTGSDTTHVSLAAWRDAVLFRGGDVLPPGQTADTRNKQWQRIRDNLKAKKVIRISGDKVELRRW